MADFNVDADSDSVLLRAEYTDGEGADLYRLDTKQAFKLGAALMRFALRRRDSGAILAEVDSVLETLCRSPETDARN